MSLFKPKEGNSTIIVISVLVLILYAILALATLNLLPAGWALMTATGAGFMTLVGAIVLLLETYFEGKMPNLKKDTAAIINTIFAVGMLIFGIILLIGQPAITGVWNGVLATGYAITFVLLAKELFFD